MLIPVQLFRRKVRLRFEVLRWCQNRRGVSSVGAPYLLKGVREGNAPFGIKVVSKMKLDLSYAKKAIAGLPGKQRFILILLGVAVAVGGQVHRQRDGQVLLTRVL